MTLPNLHWAYFTLLFMPDKTPMHVIKILLGKNYNFVVAYEYPYMEMKAQNICLLKKSAVLLISSYVFSLANGSLTAP